MSDAGVAAAITALHQPTTTASTPTGITSETWNAGLGTNGLRDVRPSTRDVLARFRSVGSDSRRSTDVLSELPSLPDNMLLPRLASRLTVLSVSDDNEDDGAK